MAGLLGFLAGIALIAGTIWLWSAVGKRRRWSEVRVLVAVVLTLVFFIILTFVALVWVTNNVGT